jgi:hypothetical protein
MAPGMTNFLTECRSALSPFDLRMRQRRCDIHTADYLEEYALGKTEREQLYVGFTRLAQERQSSSSQGNFRSRECFADITESDRSSNHLAPPNLERHQQDALMPDLAYDS